MLELDHPVPVITKALIIGSKLDIDIHSNICRIAFKGNVHHAFGDENFFREDLKQLKVFKSKLKVSLCCPNLFILLNVSVKQL